MADNENELLRWADPEAIGDSQEVDQESNEDLEDLLEGSFSYSDDQEEEEFLTDDEVVISQKKTPLWKRGEIKLPLAGLLSLTGMFVIYSFMQGGSDQLAASQNSYNTSPTQSPIPTDSSQNVGTENTENAKLKTKLALGSQEAELAQYNKQSKQKPQTTSTPAQSPAPASSPAPVTGSSYTPPPPTRIVYPTRTPSVPRPYTPTRTYSSPASPAPAPAPKSVAVAPPPVIPAPSSIAPPQKPVIPDVTETTFVTYGRLPGSNNQKPSFVKKQDGVIYTSASGQGIPTATNPLEVEQLAFLTDQKYAQIERGTQLKGELQTPVIVEPNQEFLISISEDSGNIPKGSFATASIDAVYGDGLMTASIRGIITPQGEKYLMSTDNPLMVMGANGIPLRAKRIKGGVNILKMLGNVALGAVSNATNTVNRPRTRVNTETGTVFEEYGNTDLTASLLQGGVNSVLPMLQQQQADLQADIAAGNRSSVRYLKAGKKVKIQSY